MTEDLESECLKMNTCGTCKHNVNNECNAFSREEWFLLVRKLPRVFSVVKLSTVHNESKPCDFWQKRKRK